MRRDAHYERALEAVRDVIRSDLPRAAAERLRELADGEQHHDHGTFLGAILEAELGLPHWHFPLLVPNGATKSVALSRSSDRVWAHTQVSELTTALAAAGLTILKQTGTAERFATAIQRATGQELGSVGLELTAITPLERTDSDELLVSTLDEMFERYHRKPVAILLATIVGARGDRICVSLKDEAQRVVNRDEALKNPFAMFGRRVLALSATHPILAAARSNDDPRLAAAHVARAVFVEYELIDVTLSRALLAHTLKSLGVDP